VGLKGFTNHIDVDTCDLIIEILTSPSVWVSLSSRVLSATFLYDAENSQ